MEKKKSLYTVEELAGAHEENFQCRADLVTAALKKAGKPLYTLEEAKKNSKSLWKNTSKTKKGQVIKWQEFLQTELQKSVRELILM